MGLSHFPTASEGVLPLLVMNTIVSVTLLKNMVRSVLQVVGSRDVEEETDEVLETRKRRSVSITKFKNRGEEEGEERNGAMECCVCLCRFKEEEEVSELVSCKHFFHKACLDKWFGNNHMTCPLCRSIL